MIELVGECPEVVLEIPQLRILLRVDTVEHNTARAVLRFSQKVVLELKQ